MHKIPIINISSLVSHQSVKKNNIVIDQILDATKKYGFFVVTNHGIDQSLLHSMEKLSKKFFSLNHNIKFIFASKKWNKSNENAYRGYFPSFVNGKEGMDIGDPQIRKSMINLCEKFEQNKNI